MSRSVVIVGAGITGLIAARRLTAQGFRVRVFERSERAGGYIHTGVENGWRYEDGPSTLAADERSLEILGEFGIRPFLIEASEAAKKRFLVHRGAPVAVPGAPPGILKTSLFSAGAKLRLFTEPFRRTAPPPDDESVAGFVRRRLNEEWLQTAVGTFVSGVYAGDPERLSLRHAFPRMHALEVEYGGLIRGAIKKGKGMARKLYSTERGLGGIVESLLPGIEVAYGVTIQAVTRSASGWQVQLAGETVTADAVVLAVGPGEAAALLRPLEPAPADRIAAVRQPNVAVVQHGYKRSSVQHPLDGFGMLIPRQEGIRTLGTLFPSSMFAGRAPESHVLLTSILGGMLDPELGNLDDSEILAIAAAESAKILGITEPPVWSRVRKVPRAIPQYEVGHAEVIQAVHDVEARHPGLYLRGNYVGGVALADRIGAGDAVSLEIGKTQ